MKDWLILRGEEFTGHKKTLLMVRRAFDIIMMVKAWYLTYLTRKRGMELAPFPVERDRLSRLHRAITLCLSG